MNESALRKALMRVGRDLYARGLMAGTAGNLSARTRHGFVITASGLDKGRLRASDFVEMGQDGTVRRARGGHRPSAETVLHRSVYDLFPAAGACLHVHSVSGCLAARGAGAALPLPPLELLKAFDRWEESPTVDLAVFPNHGDVARIADEVRRRFADQPPLVSAFMIHHHGTTVWGRDIDEAFHRVEALEFILDYLARLPGGARPTP